MNSNTTLFVFAVCGLIIAATCTSISSCYYDHSNTYYCVEEDIADLELCKELYTNMQTSHSSIVCRGTCGGNSDEVDITYTSSALVLNVSFYNLCFADAKCSSNTKDYNGTSLSGTVLYDSWMDISHGNISFFWQSTENLCGQVNWFRPQ